MIIREGLQVASHILLIVFRQVPRLMRLVDSAIETKADKFYHFKVWPTFLDGVLELCHVLIKDQSDGAAAPINGVARDLRRQGTYSVEREELAEEQGWIARMVHLFRSDNLDTQFEVSDVAVVVIMGVDCVLVVTNSKATFRFGRRADTLYLPGAHHRRD